MNRVRTDKCEVGQSEVHRVPHWDQEQDEEQPEGGRHQCHTAPLKAFLILASLPEPRKVGPGDSCWVQRRNRHRTLLPTQSANHGSETTALGPSWFVTKAFIWLMA